MRARLLSRYRIIRGVTLGKASLRHCLEAAKDSQFIEAATSDLELTLFCQALLAETVGSSQPPTNG